MAQDANADQDAKPATRASIELFAEHSWIQAMLGQDIEPRHYHPSADLMNDKELDQFLGAIRAQVERNLAGLPSHMDDIRSYAPARAPG